MLPETGEVLASLAAVARCALAHVVAATGDVHADPVLNILNCCLLLKKKQREMFKLSQFSPEKRHIHRTLGRQGAPPG